MKIKVKLNNLSCKIEQNKKGEWIDLKAATTLSLKAPTINGIKKFYDENVFAGELDCNKETI